MASHKKDNTSMDISGVLDESERNRKVDRLNQLTNTFDRRKGSGLAGSELDSKMTDGPADVSLIFILFYRE